MGCGGSTGAPPHGASAADAPEEATGRSSSAGEESTLLRMPGDLKTTAYTSAKPRRSEVDYNRAQKSMDERIQEGSFKAERSFKPERRGKARRAGVSAEKTMAGQKGKRSSSVVDITTAPKGPPKPEAVVAMLRKAVDSCLLFGGMTQAQCDVVINTMRPHSFGTGDCMIEQAPS